LFAQADDENTEIEINLKLLAKQATALARQKLAKKATDKRGRLYVKFAGFFYPRYRDLLLLRGQLKYKAKVEKSKEEISELEFLTQLRKTAEILPSKNTERVRTLRAILYSMIRVLQPGNETALIALVMLEDAGVEVNIDRLLTHDLADYENLQSIEYDKKDPRYIISNVKKTIMVPASTPWTDSWVKVKEGQTIRVTASRMWSMGEGPFPLVGADGYSALDMNRIKKARHSKVYSGGKRYFSGKTKVITRKLRGRKQGNLGSLLAKIGKKIYAVGTSATFRAENSGVLYFGPFEWDDYSDNYGELMVTFEISEK
jgi:hypothetical protein